HQGKGFGHRAMELLIEHVRTRPSASELLLTHKRGEGGPEGFYLRFGFEHTGKEYDGEIEMRLGLS
ncbi:MAG: GNAT family N-acetyltransferase, partial [Planctomycetota bacterium]